jgi:hypothetical protein
MAIKAEMFSSKYAEKKANNPSKYTHIPIPL